MAKRKARRQESPRHFRNIRDDATVAAAEWTITETMGLPEGSVKLVLPSGRKARADSTMATFRSHYDE